VSPGRTPVESPVLRKRLGSPVLWGLVQAFLAAAFYFSLGLVSDRALGLTWVVYAAAAAFFVLTQLSYVEGASLHQERGGATVITRYAFNELWSFVAGWAILLDYLILIALTAFVAANYLGVFWGELGEGTLEFAAAAAIIAAVSWINFRGLDPRRFERFFLFALADLAVQVVLLILGLMVLFDPKVLTAPESIAGSVTLSDLVFSFTLAVVAFTALDASSGFAGQVAIGRRGLRKLLSARLLSMLVSYVGLALVASSTLGGVAGPRATPETPLIGVVDAFEQDGVREVMRYLVAASGVAVLFTACVGAMLGLSRLGYSLAINRQIPSALGRLHSDHATPYVVIGVGAVLALVLVAPEDMEFLGAIYAFGATLAFTLVHLGVLMLRKREPDRDRPFRIPFNVRMRGVDVPMPAVAGALVSAGAFAAVLAQHGGARIVGPVWMALGITLYVVYRRSQGKPLYRRVSVPETALTRREEHTAEYGTILVPVLGTPLDDDIMQTAGRLAAEEGSDDEEGEGAQIEAMWVFEVPMSLALDGRLPDGDLKRARDALKHAKAVGEEYGGVTVNPFTIRARSAGEAIVREARRRGVEAIVMPAEEPTRVRGGVLYGGKEGLRDTFVGETTRYVVNKSTCRVVLTAPPSLTERRSRDMVIAERPGAPPPSGDPTRPMRRAADRLRPSRRHDPQAMRNRPGRDGRGPGA
jgi:basic amino acid/polyamine antiporter, APA family